jgi:hypothetical protein
MDLENNSISLYKRISDLNIDSVNGSLIDVIIASYIIE